MDTVLERVLHDSFAESGLKLYITMNIRNVTVADDSKNGNYECHSYGVNDIVQSDTYLFSITVIESKTL